MKLTAFDRWHKYRDSANFLRDEKIYLYRQAGMTFCRIGEKFDLSTARVAAIVSKREYWAKWYVKLQQRSVVGDDQRSMAMARKLLAYLA